MSTEQSTTQSSTTIQQYTPLIVVIGLITAVTAALSIVDIQSGAFSWIETIRYFMAGFFIVFAGFKLMDLPAFANGYAKYDLLARHWKGYGYLYPWIELAFGIAMVVAWHPDWLLLTEFGLMTFSGIGVVIKLAKREEFQCACLGTVLKVPLTYLTVVEDFGMAALALALIILG